MVTVIQTNCSRLRTAHRHSKRISTMTTMDGATLTKLTVALTLSMQAICLLMRTVMESVTSSISIGTMTAFQMSTRPIRASMLMQVIREPTRGILIPMVMDSVTDRLQCTMKPIQSVLLDQIHSHTTRTCQWIPMAMVCQTNCQRITSVTWLKIRTMTTMDTAMCPN